MAERLLAIQGSPVGTMKECLEMSAIKEADGSESAEQMVQNIYNDFLTVAEELKSGMELADEVNDETTGDMLLAIHQSIEKHNWMLKAYLG